MDILLLRGKEEVSMMKIKVFSIPQGPSQEDPLGILMSIVDEWVAGHSHYLEVVDRRVERDSDGHPTVSLIYFTRGVKV
jgi:hypothetical protein